MINFKNKNKTFSKCKLCLKKFFWAFLMTLNNVSDTTIFYTLKILELKIFKLMKNRIKNHLQLKIKIMSLSSFLKKYINTWKVFKKYKILLWRIQTAWMKKIKLKKWLVISKMKELIFKNNKKISIRTCKELWRVMSSK